MTKQQADTNTARRQRQISFADADYQKLTAALSGGDWLKARDIRLRTGLAPRTIRAMAERHGDALIGTGNGYRLVAFASVEELEQAHRSLISRAKKLFARASALKRARPPSNDNSALEKLAA